MSDGTRFGIWATETTSYGLDTVISLLNKNPSGKGITLPNTIGWTANKTLATIQDIYGCPVYSTSSTYAVGDKVIYGGLPYRCITAVETAESFDSNKWALISLNTDFVDTFSDQTMSGVKSFENGIQIGEYKIRKDGNYILYLEDYQNSTGLYIKRNEIYPSTNNYTSLGTATKKFKNLYLSGDLTDGTNSITIANIQEKVQVKRYI